MEYRTIWKSLNLILELYLNLNWCASNSYEILRTIFVMNFGLNVDSLLLLTGTRYTLHNCELMRTRKKSENRWPNVTTIRSHGSTHILTFAWKVWQILNQMCLDLIVIKWFQCLFLPQIFKFYLNYYWVDYLFDLISVQTCISIDGIFIRKIKIKGIIKYLKKLWLYLEIS